MQPRVTSQLTPHGGEPIELPSRWGNLAALRGRAAGTGGVAALLLPGFTGSKEDFAPLIDPIAGAGFTVLAIDLPGQFDSSGPADEKEYLPDALGAGIAELIGTLPAREVLLLGHSYGGIVARSALLAGAVTAGLTLLDSGPRGLDEGSRRSIIEAGEAILRSQGIEAANALRRSAGGEPFGGAVRSPEAEEFLSRRFLATRPECLLGMATGLCREPDRTPELEAVLRCSGTPSLVICGHDDDVWPRTVQHAMAERLDTDFAVVPDAAHSPNTENPAGLLARLLPTWSTWTAG
jgi:pimeloyl-ACP methyl ester carboxylesterase